MLKILRSLFRRVRTDNRAYRFGKTRFLTLIGGVRQAFHGNVKVLNQEFISSGEVTRVKVRKQIWYIFQQHNLLKSLIARQNVSTTLEMQNTMTEQQRYDRAAEMLKAVGLK